MPGVTATKAGTYSHGRTGTTAVDANEVAVPASFVADTANVYGVPGDRPVTMHTNSAAVGEHVLPSGVDVTVYFEIARPPSSAGAVHVTRASLLPANPDGVPGVAGAAPGVRDLAVEADPMPDGLVAVTDTEYDAPAVKPTKVHDSVGTTDVQVTAAPAMGVADAV